MPAITVADLDEIRQELGPLITEAVRQNVADFDRRTDALTAAVLADREWLDTAALVAYLGIADRTVREYRKRGAFGPVSVRFSKAYVRRSNVDAYLAAAGEGARADVSSPIASPQTAEGTKPGLAA